MTTEQRERLTTIASYRRVNHGRAPTLRELATLWGLKSPTSAKYHVMKLQAAGLVAVDEGLVRTLRLTPDGVFALAQVEEPSAP